MPAAPASIIYASAQLFAASATLGGPQIIAIRDCQPTFQPYFLFFVLNNT